MSAPSKLLEHIKDCMGSKRLWDKLDEDGEISFTGNYYRVEFSSLDNIKISPGQFSDDSVSATIKVYERFKSITEQFAAADKIQALRLQVGNIIKAKSYDIISIEIGNLSLLNEVEDPCVGTFEFTVTAQMSFNLN